MSQGCERYGSPFTLCYLVLVAQTWGLASGAVEWAIYSPASIHRCSVLLSLVSYALYPFFLCQKLGVQNGSILILTDTGFNCLFWSNIRMCVCIWWVDMA